MAKTPSGGDRPVEHGPLRADRIRPGNYSPQFLESLKAQNKVVPVGENWDPAHGVPATANWVIHPNGDLERVGFD